MKFFQSLLIKWFYKITKCYNHTIVHTIRNILPWRAMPYTYNKKYNKIGKTYRKCTSNVSKMFFPPLSKLVHSLRKWHRIEYIIFHPCSKSNMPSSPEFTYRLRKIRLSEILIHSYAKHLCSTYYYIYTTREIHVQLYRVHKNSHNV